jgi:hypothetical protein
MGIYVDNWKIRVDVCRSLRIFVDIASSRGVAGLGAPGKFWCFPVHSPY